MAELSVLDLCPILEDGDARASYARSVALAQTAERLGLRAPVVIGDTALRRDFEVVSYPWTVMIGKDGKAWTAFRGAHAEDTFRKAFEEGLR